MTEYLDIVNEKDEVIGRDTRKNVHDRFEIHRGVHVFVIDSERRILIQKRSDEKDYYPGFFDISVGAQVSSGESYEEAASRELKEELGCHDGPLSYIADYDAYSTRQREKRRIFIHRCDGPFYPDPGEVAAVEFLSVEAIRGSIVSGMQFTEGFKRSFEIYCRLQAD